jgi:hypothetical protein
MWSGWGRPCLLHDYGGTGERNARATWLERWQQRLQSNMGSANYNALELSARHTSGLLEFSAAYTYSKSLDQSSNIGEEVNPFNPALGYALSSFSVKHNFVVSYEYQLPLDRFFHPNRLSSGWSFSGITHFASGFPIAMVNNGDNSLIGTNPTE